MKNDAHNSFDAFVARLRTSQPDTLPSVDELAAFLLNPEAHLEHVKMILRAAEDAGQLRLGKPLIRLYDHAPFRWLFPLRLRLNRNLKAFADRVEQLGPQLKATVQPVSLDVDILPVLAIDTDPSYRAIDMAAIAQRDGWMRRSAWLALRSTVFRRLQSTRPALAHSRCASEGAEKNSITSAPKHCITE